MRSHVYDPRVHADIPPTQPETAIAELKAEETHALTQVANRNPGASQEEPPTKRLRDEPLSVRDLQEHTEAMTKTVGWVLKQKTTACSNGVCEKVKEAPHNFKTLGACRESHRAPDFS